MSTATSSSSSSSSTTCSILYPREGLLQSPPPPPPPPSSPLPIIITTCLQSWLATMARLAVAGCAAIGLYFLLVCLVTGHSSVLISSASQQSSEISATSRAPSSSSLRFQAEVDADDQQSAVVVDDIRVLPDPPSRKQRKQHLRAKSASKRGNPTDRHRYTLSDGGPSGDADESKDDDPKRSSPSSYSDCSYHLAFTLVEANGSSGQSGKRSKLLGKFRNCLSSVLRHLNSTGYESGALCIHLITSGGDALRSAINDVIVRVHEHLVEMRSNADDYGHGHRKQWASVEDSKDFDAQDQDQDQDEDHHHLRRPLTKYFFIDSAAVEARLEGGPSPRAPLLATLRRHFTNQRSGPSAYYSNALFFYSMVLHQVLPSAVADRLLLLDVDVQLEANLLELYEEFGRFTAEQVMGIAYEQQPVYRHILHEYRRLNENTTAGSPPSSSPSSSPSSPGGFPGYNSGVLLLHLRKMRSSFLYNSLLNEALIGHLARKYHFRGHLGDQDFYTLAALDYPQLFYTLDCAWNRQLCQWWRFHGYGAVFDAYHRCSSSTGVKLYHGNCNSAMPSMAVPTSDGNFEQLRR